MGDTKQLDLNKYSVKQRLFLEEKFDEIPRTGTIEIKPMYPKKLEYFSFRSFKGKDGLVYGIPIKDNGDGTYEFRTIQITGHTEYDLTNEDQAHEAAILRAHRSCLNSENANGKPLFMVFDKTEEAKKSLDKMSMGRKALDLALDMAGGELADFARVLGISPESNDAILVKKMVAEAATNKPKDFMESYDDMNRGVKQILKRAIAANLIKYSIDGGYVWKDGLALGATEQAAITQLTRNKTLLNTMNVESKNQTSHTYSDDKVIEEVKEEAPKEAPKKASSDEWGNTDKPETPDKEETENVFSEDSIVEEK